MPFDVAGALREGYTPSEIAQHLASQKGFDLDNALKEGYSPEDIIGHLNAQETPSRSVLGTIADSAIDLTKGAVGLGESAVGLADLATGNLAGKGLAAIGYDPKATKSALSDMYSPARALANQNVEAANGFVDTVISLVDNPSVALGGILESAPGSLGIVGAVRSVALRMLAKAGLEAGTPAAAAFLKANSKTLLTVGAATEGLQTTGAIQEKGRQEGREWSDTALPATAAGVGTAAISYGTSMIPGLRDVETAAATSLLGSGEKRSLFQAGKEIAKGMFKEGVLEEMPQSAQEQLFSNLALGKPWHEGVLESAAQGLVVGGLQAGGFSAVTQARERSPLEDPVPVPDTGITNDNVSVDTAIKSSSDEVFSDLEKSRMLDELMPAEGVVPSAAEEAVAPEVAPMAETPIIPEPAAAESKPEFYVGQQIDYTSKAGNTIRGLLQEQQADGTWVATDTKTGQTITVVPERATPAPIFEPGRMIIYQTKQGELTGEIVAPYGPGAWKAVDMKGRGFIALESKAEPLYIFGEKVPPAFRAAATQETAQNATQETTQKTPAQPQSFTENMSPLMKARVTRIFEQEREVEGRRAPLGQAIETRMAAGWSVGTDDLGRHMASPDGVKIREKDLTKTGMDYAEWLQNTRTGERDSIRKAGTETPAPPALSVGEPLTEADAQKLAQDTGVIYNGMQESRNQPAFPLFTDPLTSSTFAIPKGKTILEALQGLRARFSAPIPQASPLTIERSKQILASPKDTATAVQHLTGIANALGREIRFVVLDTPLGLPEINGKPFDCQSPEGKAFLEEHGLEVGPNDTNENFVATARILPVDEAGRQWTTIEIGHGSNLLDPWHEFIHWLEAHGFIQSEHGGAITELETDELAKRMLAGEDVMTRRGPPGGSTNGRNDVDSRRAVGEASLGANVAGGARYAAAWHGSPYTFEKFDSSKIGTGEGAQAYGHGLYFAGKKEVAEYYKKSVKDATASPRRFFLDAELVPGSPEYHAATLLETTGKTLQGVRKEVRGWIEKAKPGEDTRHYQLVFEALQRADSKKDFTRKNPEGRLYQVELAPAEDEYLLWDKPLSEQSEKVKGALAEAVKDTNRKSMRQRGAKIAGMKDTAGSFYRMLESLRSEGGKAASEYLHSLGIRGVKYLDGTSRSKGEGNYNYVIFSDKDVSVTARYSVRRALPKILSTIDANPNGFTINPKTGGMVPSGFAVAPTKQTEQRFPPADRAGIEGYIKHFTPVFETDPRSNIGGWLESGELVLDVSYVVPDLETAALLAQRGNQDAIYDISGGREIKTPQAIRESDPDKSARVDKAELQRIKDTLEKRVAEAAQRQPRTEVPPRNEAQGPADQGIAKPRYAIRKAANPQTETPEFKKWFGDSKVVDENGKPLVVYHGTTAPENFSEFAVGEPITDDFDSEMFRTGSGGDMTTYLGSHFADSPKTANMFARGLYGEREGRRVDGRVYPVYLSIQNPFRVSEDDMRSEMMRGSYSSYTIDGVLENHASQEGKTDEEVAEQYEFDADFRSTINDEALANEGSGFGDPSFELAMEMADQYRASLQKRGYDGIIYDNEVEGGIGYIAFEPTQIKSAIGNTGAFSPTNPDIRYSVRRKPDALSGTGVHYSTKPLTELDPSKAGTGFRGNEYRRIIAGSPNAARAYIYIHEGRGINPEYGINGTPYRVDFSNFYEADYDPKGFAKTSRSLNEFEQKVMRAGYDGIVLRDQGMAVFLGKKTIPVTPINEQDVRAVPAVREYQPPKARYSVRAYHGSPHTFEQFDIKKIGTGEGAQAYGHGLYFAGRKEVAEYYKKELAPGEGAKARVFDEGGGLYSTWALNRKVGGKVDHGISFLVERTTKEKAERAKAEYDATLRGRLYEVELAPDEDEYLLWDKPLSEQSEKVKRALADVNARSEYGLYESRPEDAIAIKDLPIDPLVKVKLRTELNRTKGGLSTAIDNLRGLSSSPQWQAKAEDFSARYASHGVRLLERLQSPLNTGSAVYKRLSDDLGSDKAASEYLHSLGIRGIKYLDGASRGKGEGDYNYVVFSDQDVSVQARYAVSKNLPAVTTPATPAAPAPREESRTDAFIRAWQDRMRAFDVVRDALKRSGKVMSELTDVSRFETLSRSKTANSVTRFMSHTVEPLVKKIAESHWTMEQVQDYAMLRHIPEANAYLIKLHNDPDITANGISTAEAQAELQVYTADPNFAELKALADEMNDISRGSLEILANTGLLTDEARSAMESAYQYYVPLKGGDESQKTGTGKGMRVKAAMKRRFGHAGRTEFILENIIKQRESALRQAFKNESWLSVLKFTMEANDPAIATVGKPVKRAVLKNAKAFAVESKQGALIDVFDSEDSARKYIAQNGLQTVTDIVETRRPEVVMQARSMLEDNEISGYINGYQIRIQLNDPTLARAATNAGVETLPALLSAGKTLNRYLTKVYTQYNPEFALRNIVRDFTAGIVNLTGDYGATMTAKVIANYPKAMKELMKARNDFMRSKVVREYGNDGGHIGSAWLPGIEQLNTDLESSYLEYLGIQKAFSYAYQSEIEKGHSTQKAYTIALMKTGVASIKQIPFIGHFLKLVDRVNMLSESSFRLATYMTLRENGISRAEAAEAAKDATINFDRSGELTNQAGALYLFFNPAVQGVQRSLFALTQSKHKHQAQALVGSMVMAAFALAMHSDPDDWDKINPGVKERSLVLSIGGKQYISIPLSYEYGVYATMGYALADLVRGKTKPIQASLQVAQSIVNAASPLGNPIDEQGKFMATQLLPTTMKLAIAPTINQNTFGAPLMPQKYTEYKPDSATMWRSTAGTMYDHITSFLNEATGGTPYSKGLIDISPETVRFYVNSLTGGTGQFFTKIANLGYLAVEGAEPEKREVPFVSSFLKDITPQEARSKFWEKAQEIKAASEAFKKAKDKNDREALQAIKEEFGPLLTLAEVMKDTTEMAKLKRDMIEKIRTDASLSLVQKRVQMEMLEKQEEAAYDKFLGIFNGRVNP